MPRRPASATLARATAALLVVVAALAALPYAASSAEAPADALTIQSIDTSAYPEVTMQVLLPTEVPAGTRLRAADVSVRENGVEIGNVTARSAAAAGRDPVHAILVIDTSGSMEGQAIEDAKRAAREFVAAMGREDRVAIVAFSEAPAVLHGFTDDKRALDAAIDGLEPRGETALYDAIVSAADMLRPERDVQNAIVLLSDGGDTVSTSSIEAAAAALSRAGAPVHAVALQTGEYNPAALESLARGSGGRLVAVSESAQFASTFTSIAKQLQTPYEITFVGEAPPTEALDIEVTVTLPDGRAYAKTSVPNPGVRVAAQVAPQAPLPSAGWPVLIAGLIFSAVTILSGTVLTLAARERSTLRKMGFYEQTGGPGTVGSGNDYGTDSVTGRVLDAASTLGAKSGFTGIIATELERSGLPLRPVEYMTLHILGVLAGGFAVQVIGRNLALTIAAILAIALGPVATLRVLARRRLAAFEAQLPEVLNLLASSLRTGWGLLQAVGIVVGEMAPPAGPEFGRVVTEARLGLPVEQALEKMAARLDSVDFSWAVTAIAIQREVGGNLAEVLDTVANTVRERGTLRRQISSLTAEGRLSAIILLALPFVETGLLIVVNPNYLSSLLAHPVGVIAIFAAIVLLVIGAIWLRNIVGIEV